MAKTLIGEEFAPAEPDGGERARMKVAETLFTRVRSQGYCHTWERRALRWPRRRATWRPTPDGTDTSFTCHLHTTYLQLTTLARPSHSLISYPHPPLYHHGEPSLNSERLHGTNACCTAHRIRVA